MKPQSDQSDGLIGPVRGVWGTSSEPEVRLRWDGRLGLMAEGVEERKGGLGSGKDSCVGSRVTVLWWP